MMKALQGLDTPLKRASFLVSILGAIMLAASLVVWTQESRNNKIYYSEDHYEWLPVDDKFVGDVQRQWSWDYPCLKQLTEARSMRLSSFGYRAYTAVREGEIRQEIAQNYDYDSAGRFIKNKDTITFEERIQERLHAWLGLTSFNVSERDRIFEKCVRQTLVGAKHVKTSHRTNLEDWPNDHPLVFVLGFLFLAAGFMGSFGYRSFAWVINGTFGRIVSWVNEGSENKFNESYKDNVSEEAKLSTLNREAFRLSTVDKQTKTSDKIEPIIEQASAKISKSRVGSLIPHLLVLGGLAMLLGLTFVAESFVLARFFGGVAASAIDPINLAVATVVGLLSKRQIHLFSRLLVFGIVMAVIVVQLNASLGIRLTPELILTKIVAAIAVGYIVNFMMVIIRKKT